MEFSVSEEVRRWIESNLEAACSAQDLLAAMQQQGIEPDYANAALSATLAARAGRRSFADASILTAGTLNVPVLARVAWPRIAVLGPVMTGAECDALIALARPRLAPSTVVDPQSGEDVVATYRGSEGMFFRPGENQLVSSLDIRLAALLNLPLENGEGLQVLRYPVAAESASHFDFLPVTNESSRASVLRSGQRLATLIVYLNAVEEGGETVFPELGLSVVPQKGHGLCFEYTDAAGDFDRRSLHAGAAVRQGEKWIVTKWMRSRRFVSRTGVES